MNTCVNRSSSRYTLLLNNVALKGIVYTGGSSPIDRYKDRKGIIASVSVPKTGTLGVKCPSALNRF